MKKFNPNKNIIITLIIVIIIVTVLSITMARRAVEQKTSFVQVVVNDTVATVDKALYTPVRWFENGVGSIQDLFVTYQENERLKGKIDNYDEVVQQNESQKREISNLKEELDLNETLTNYEKKAANVISRSPDSWQDIIVVDQGSKDGISDNMAVMAKNGLIGRVLEVSAHSSKVELLTSDNQTSNHFPVRITTEKGDAFGLLKGYDRRNQALIVEELTGEKDIKKDDTVQTSGLGGNSPSDLNVGKVIEAEPDDFGLDRKVYVQPAADVNDVSVVTIIERTVGED